MKHLNNSTNPTVWMVLRTLLFAVCITWLAAMVGATTPAIAQDGDVTTITVTTDDDAEAPIVVRQFTRYDALLASLTIFVVAIFVGFEIITKVPPTLHTPLMSGSNAISGITIVGAILATGFSNSYFVATLGMIALTMATVNVVGGFLVTHRMLEMFRKKK